MIIIVCIINTTNRENLEENCNILHGLNHDITENDVRKIIFHSKNGKAIGIENLPNEI